MSGLDAVLDLVGTIALIGIGVIGIDRIGNHRDSWIRLTSGALLLAFAVIALGGHA